MKDYYIEKRIDGVRERYYFVDGKKFPGSHSAKEYLKTIGFGGTEALIYLKGLHDDFMRSQR